MHSAFHSFCTSAAFLLFLRRLNPNWTGGRDGGGGNNLISHCGCEQCVYMPKLVVCKWVWYRLTAPENSSRSGHVYFPEGSPRRHQDIFMIHPLAKPPPRPTALQSYWQLGLEHMLLLQLFGKRCLWWQRFFKEASVGGSHHQDTSWKGLILERWSPGWLKGCWGAQEKSVTFWVGMCGRLLERKKKKNRCDVFVSGLILPELLTDPDST